MKRSKMLDIMESESRGKIERYELDHLLSVIEEVGMLPSMTKESEDEVNEMIQKSIHCNSIVHDIDQLLSWCVWDDE